ELLLRRLADADVVTQALSHLHLAVQATQNRHGDADLRLLAGLGLQVTPDQEVVQLLATPQLDVGLDLDRVAALHQRVEALAEVDRRALLDALGEVVALQHPLDSDLPRQGQHVSEGELAKPFAVATYLGPANVDDAADLR